MQITTTSTGYELRNGGVVIRLSFTEAVDFWLHVEQELDEDEVIEGLQRRGYTDEEIEKLKKAETEDETILYYLTCRYKDARTRGSNKLVDEVISENQQMIERYLK